MKNWDMEDYKYPHNERGHFVLEKYLPDQLRGKKYYFPGSVEGEWKNK